jgi:hypothetical protein
MTILHLWDDNNVYQFLGFGKSLIDVLGNRTNHDGIIPESESEDFPAKPGTWQAS